MKENTIELRTVFKSYIFFIMFWVIYFDRKLKKKKNLLLKDTV